MHQMACHITVVLSTFNWKSKGKTKIFSNNLLYSHNMDVRPWPVSIALPGYTTDHYLRRTNKQCLISVTFRKGWTGLSRKRTTLHRTDLLQLQRPKIVRYYLEHTNIHTKCLLFLISTTTGMFQQIFVKCPNLKFHENPYCGSCAISCRQTRWIDAQTWQGLLSIFLIALQTLVTMVMLCKNIYFVTPRIRVLLKNQSFT
jgi:hypothetical protein